VSPFSIGEGKDRLFAPSKREEEGYYKASFARGVKRRGRGEKFNVAVMISMRLCTPRQKGGEKYPKGRGPMRREKKESPAEQGKFYITGKIANLPRGGKRMPFGLGCRMSRRLIFWIS